MGISVSESESIRRVAFQNELTVLQGKPKSKKNLQVCESERVRTSTKENKPSLRTISATVNRDYHNQTVSY
jgi:hypothetical protein